MHSATFILVLLSLISLLCISVATVIVYGLGPAGQMKKRRDASQDPFLLQPTLNPANELGLTNSRTLKKSIHPESKDINPYQLTPQDCRSFPSREDL